MKNVNRILLQKAFVMIFMFEYIETLFLCVIEAQILLGVGVWVSLSESGALGCKAMMAVACFHFHILN